MNTCLHVRHLSLKYRLQYVVCEVRSEAEERVGDNSVTTATGVTLIHT
jgi:hypothetical protein